MSTLRPRTLDHVAFWVAGRGVVQAFLVEQLGLRVIAQEANFTLLGGDARRGKLTLFDAPGPRVAGPLAEVVLSVPDFEAVVDRLGGTTVDAGEGIMLSLVPGQPGDVIDLAGVVLYAADPAATATAYEQFGFERVRDARVAVAGAFVELVVGDPTVPERPLLNHLAVLVDSAQGQADTAVTLGIEVESMVDAANTVAAFLTGPGGVRIEYVEHKPTFSLT